ncbi:hypothetical protein [Lewinella sp. JB7]|uniref:hypothetical protein n=1 Tax=Lewinella sp. JB7 TaxID=2962887 RepID=UPI0020C95AF8|nr:hypothetical protein [Lewinella sp. JB7]MCP9237148.1 hypothetical protein [Lewinella sp. JB7]
MDVITHLTAKERAAVKYALDLHGTDAYFVRYYKLLSGPVTAEEAYQELEAELVDLTGRRRYQDYQSFRKKRWQYCTRLSTRK